MTQYFEVFGDLARSMTKGTLFRVIETYTREGHPVAKLEVIE